MFIKIPDDNPTSFIDNNILRIIESKKLIDKYFISWLILKHKFTDIAFNVSENSPSFSVMSNGNMVTICEFSLKSDSILYSIENDKILYLIEEKLFLNFIKESLKKANSNGIEKAIIPFYGNVNFRLSSSSYTPKEATVICRMLINKRDIYTEAERLSFILKNINSIDKYSKQEEQIFNSIYNQITNQYINFNGQLDENIDLLEQFINLNKIVSY